MKPGTYKTQFLGTEYAVHYVTDVNKAIEYIQRLMNQPVELMALDTETERFPKYSHIDNAALSPHLSKVRLLQIFTGRTALVFDIKQIGTTEIFKEFLERGRFVGHFSIFDIQYLIKDFKVDHINIGCTHIIARLVFHATRPTDEGLSASLKNLVNTAFGGDFIKEMGASDWAVPDLTWEQIEYSALDVIATYALAQRLAPKLVKYGLERVYKLYKEAQTPLAKMQLNGIYLDVDTHRDMIVKWRSDLYAAKKALIKITGLEKITSSTLGEYLQESLSPSVLAIWPRTETGKLATDSNAFIDFSHIDIVAPFAKYQKMEKLCTSFGNSLIAMVNPETDRLHPSYKIAGARTGRLSCVGPNLQQCYSKDTELLTKRGWIRIEHLDKTDVVAQWSKDFSIRFVTPTAYMRYYNVSKLVHLHNVQTDLMVTPNHRCLVQSRRFNKWSDVEAKDFPSDKLQYHAGMYNEGTESVNPWWIKLVVAVQADGHIQNSGINFAFNRMRKVKRLQDIVSKLGLKLTTHTPGKHTKYKFRLCMHPVTESIISFLGVSKLFPWSVLTWDRASINIFIEELRYWDGLSTRATDNYTSIREHNVDVVQTMFALSNRRAHKRLYDWNNKQNSNHSIAYTVDIPNRNYSMTTNIEKDIISYEDDVYCVEVSSTYLLTRRNNKIIVSGNSPADKTFRANFQAREGYSYVLADYGQVEVRAAAELSGDPMMLKAFSEGIDIYKFTAAQMLHKKIEDVTYGERKGQKPLILGLQFGLSAPKLGRYAKKNYDIDISDSEADKQVNDYRKLYSVFRKWQLDTIKTCAKENYTSRTLTGKLRKYDPDNAFGNVLNHIVQGSCLEGMLHALNIVDPLLPKTSQIIASIHDEIICEVEDKDVEEVKEALEFAMITGYTRIFPSGRTTKGLVAATSGKNWAEAKS